MSAMIMEEKKLNFVSATLSEYCSVGEETLSFLVDASYIPEANLERIQSSGRGPASTLFNCICSSGATRTSEWDSSIPTWYESSSFRRVGAADALWLNHASSLISFCTIALPLWLSLDLVIAILK